ncbi:MAG: hypothetical protein ABIO49_06470 [Dokdonella sp.]
MPAHTLPASTGESLAVGSLMNAHALVELVVIKAGLDAGVIGYERFTMVMAIAATLVTKAIGCPHLRRKAAAPR